MRVRAVLLAGLLTACTAATAEAATFTVNSTSDTAGASGCTAVLCTIRTAISAASANGNAVDDTVVIPAGTYTLNAQLGSLSVPSGATRITLQGAGANTTFIQPATDSTFRVLAVGSSAGVAITGLTLRNGTVTTGAGGNLLVQSQATASLSGVRVTNGRAPQGGGIAALGATTLTIARSLVDGNTATGANLTDLGGGVYIQGQTSATATTITDSTIAGNSARNGAGLGMVNNTGQPPALRGVTLARNGARAGPGGAGVGGIFSQSTNARFQGSIVAGNTSTINLGGGQTTVPSNCGLATAAADEGGNLESQADCGLAGHQNTDPQLAASLDDASEPPALAIPPGSPAVDIAACGSRTSDQRGVPRPQGETCDAGAFEVDQPATMTIATGPSGTVASGNAEFTFNASEPGVNPVCRLTGPGQGGTFVACYKSNAQPYSDLANGSYTFSVRDGAFANAPIASRSFTVAQLDTAITSGPTGPTNDATPTFTFSGTSAAAFECRFDSAAFASCSSPFTPAANLAQGEHTFEVRALSAAGAPDPTPASRAFTVDTVAPSTNITAGPSGLTNDATPTFSFSSPEAGATFECRVDAAAFAACSSAHTTTTLSQGAHTFEVRALDAAGNVDGTPASRTFTVDSVAPQTTINTGPPSPGNDSTPTFTFSSSEAGSTFQCRVDTAAFANCTSPHTTAALSAGNHTFEVRATDAAGNADQSPAQRTFEIDLSTPDTEITGGPGPLTNDATPTFTFSGSNGAASFQCKLDAAAFAPCTSPYTTTALTDGEHAAQIRAVNAIGTPDASPASVTFVVDLTPPATPAVVSGPDGATTNNSPEFAFTATESVTCRLDGPGAAVGELGACVSPRTFSGLQPGDYVFVVRSVDAAGNASETRRAFTVTVPQAATPTPTVQPSQTPAPTPTPTPQPNQTVVVAPAGGTILVRRPGSSRFEPLGTAAGIPFGSEVDAREGRVTLTSIPKAGAPPETADFYDGLFTIHKVGQFTELRLSEKLTGCKPAKKRASAAQTRKPKTRKLWGDGKGKFRTKGQYSSATVRGTRWLVQDACTTTLTRVTQGVVAVNDFAKRKTVLVKAGKRYTARPRKR